MALTDSPTIIDGPGVYPDVPEHIYHADPVPGGSLSSSAARTLLDCPAKYHWQRTNPQPYKRTFEIGSAAHKVVLGAGPELAVIDVKDWRTKKAQAELDEAREQGKIPVKRDEFEMVTGMAAAIRRHPIASRLLDPEHGAPEQSLVWECQQTGVTCRARLDWLPNPSGGRLIVPDYKGLALDTPLPTPTGWTTVRSVNVGDQLLGSDGRPCVVTAKSERHERRCYRVTFDDGSSVVCDDEHLWSTRSGPHERTAPQSVLSTDEIRRTLLHHSTHQRQHRVLLPKSLDLPEVKLPLDPYVLGVWLGDGAASGSRITKPDDELFENIAARGFRLGVKHVDPRSGCQTRAALGLSTILRAMGLLNAKRIPDEYLRGSLDQRLDLLRGLMDTDGSWNSTRGQAVFVSMDKAMALQVQELALTLGQRAVFHTYRGTGYGKSFTAYRVTFTPTRGLNPFLLSRKASQVEFKTRSKSTRRLVTSVEECPTVTTQCLAVDSPDSTYLCTEWFIPTHNTSVSAHPRSFGKHAADYGYHQQDAWYLDGVRTLGLGGDDAAFLFIVQEKTPPYVVTIFELDTEARRIGHRRNLEARLLYARCVADDHWPAYTDQIELIGLPAWATQTY